MLERDFQARLIKKLRRLLPGCVILKNDPEYLQGVPDLLILWRDMWAMLEDKASATARLRPNQAFYIEEFNQMSFAAFIHPENEAQVLYELSRTFKSRWNARVSKRQQLSLD